MKISDEPPAYGSDAPPPFEVPPLPSGVTLKKVYKHFLKSAISLLFRTSTDWPVRYLFDHAQNFFKNNTVDGERIWERLGAKSIIVLATPNGWGVSEQGLNFSLGITFSSDVFAGFLKQVVVDAGIINKGQEEERLLFVTEGEASVHYALHYSQSRTWMKEGALFAVTDAGGSTVDSTLYRCKAIMPKLVLEEVCASECG